MPSLHAAVRDELGLRFGREPRVLHEVAARALGLGTVGLGRRLRLCQAQAWRENQSGNFMKEDRKSTRLNSSHTVISYAVFCLKKKNKNYQVQNESDLQIRAPIRQVRDNSSRQ